MSYYSAPPHLMQPRPDRHWGGLVVAGIIGAGVLAIATHTDVVSNAFGTAESTPEPLPVIGSRQPTASSSAGPSTSPSPSVSPSTKPKSVNTKDWGDVNVNPGDTVAEKTAVTEFIIELAQVCPGVDTTATKVDKNITRIGKSFLENSKMIPLGLDNDDITFGKVTKQAIEMTIDNGQRICGKKFADYPDQKKLQQKQMKKNSGSTESETTGTFTPDKDESVTTGSIDPTETTGTFTPDK